MMPAPLPRAASLACALAALAVAGCVPQHPDPRCLHYGSARRAQEGVPECEFRGPHTLINGLPAAHDWNAS